MANPKLRIFNIGQPCLQIFLQTSMFMKKHDLMLLICFRLYKKNLVTITILQFLSLFFFFCSFVAPCIYSTINKSTVIITTTLNIESTAFLSLLLFGFAMQIIFRCLNFVFHTIKQQQSL